MINFWFRTKSNNTGKFSYHLYQYIRTLLQNPEEAPHIVWFESIKTILETTGLDLHWNSEDTELDTRKDLRPALAEQAATDWQENLASTTQQQYCFDQIIIAL